MEEGSPNADDVLTSFQEYLEEPSLMRKSYCNPLQKEEDVKKVTYITTERAIQELLDFCKANPGVYKDILKKRKMDAIQNSGVFSSLKVFFFKSLFGKKYLNSLISEEEFEQKFNNLLRGIEVLQDHNRDIFYKDIHDSTQSFVASSIIEDLRGKHKRFTFNDIKDNIADSPQIKKSDLTLLTKSFVRKSLSEFRMNALGNKGRSDFNGNISIPPPPPACFLETSVDNLPLPPPPLPANLLLHSNKSTNPVARKRKFDETDIGGVHDKKAKKSTTRFKSPPRLTLHDEILNANQKNLLRSTNIDRSPGGTPLSNPSTTNPCKDDLTSTLRKVLETKFANIRSPSPANASSFNQSYNSFSDY